MANVSPSLDLAVTAADHRTDIDALRGIAVLSVLAVHAFPEQVAGGFIGVDIFFVLSGYLISTIVFRSLDAGTFTLGDFYARRARRIFPALCVVLAGSLITALCFTFPSDLRQVGRHVAAGAAFSANLALWMEAGYFDARSELKPLLHLWSLGIEEQFYLLGPLAAMLLLKARRHALAWIGLALLLSFGLNVAGVQSRPSATFYLLPTRAWELLIGVALAWTTLYVEGGPVGWLQRRLGQPDDAALRSGLSIAGAALLAGTLLALDKSAAFPGWWALPPTLGTALLLAAGPQAWVNRHLLHNRLLVFYGQISYPLYLWHWPLLVFPLLVGMKLDFSLRALVLALSVALATLTVEYVERPIRQGRAGPRAALGLTGALAAIGLSGLLVVHTDGMLATYPAAVRTVAAAEFGFDFGAYRSARCFLDLEQGPAHYAAECAEPARPGGPQALLWGDSHAASLYPGLSAATSGVGSVPALMQLTKARCPPLLELPPGASNQCAQANDFVRQRITQRPPHTVIIGAYWTLYDGPGGQGALDLGAVRRTVDWLAEQGVRRVVVVGHLPTWLMPLPRVLLREWQQTRTVPERSASQLDPHAAAMDLSLRLAVQGSGAEFVSPMEQLCNRSGCLVTTLLDGVARPLAHDESHLTVEGSTLLVARSAALRLQ